MSNPSVHKACPIILRLNGTATELLAFKHPHEKCQIVKGTVDPGEHPAEAARRELIEESGLVANDDPELLVISDDLLDHNTWHFYLCRVSQPVPDNWDHQTLDDGGHVFSFFWHPLDRPLDDSWHPLFHSAFAVFKPVLNSPRNYL